MLPLFMRVLALAALGTSLYLLTASISTTALAGCGPDGGCDAVLATRWASWLGIPASAMSAALYIIMLAALWHIGPNASPRRRRIAWALLLPMAVTIELAALWFLALQLFAVGAFCIWCVTTHILGLFLAALIVLAAPIDWSERDEPPLDPDDVSHRRQSFSVRQAAALCLPGLLGIIVLIAGQLLYSPPTHRVIAGDPTGTTPNGSPNTGTPTGTTNGQSANQRHYALPGGSVGLDPATLPIIGPAHAPHIVVLVMDYTCPHCRTLHGFLLQARERYGDAFAFIVLPVPMDADCNPEYTETDPPNVGACDYARIALAAYRVEPRHFETVDRWLLAPDTRPSVPDARAFLVQTVGEAAAQEALAKPWIEEQLAKNMRLYGLAKFRRLPVVLMPGGFIDGRPATAQQLWADLEEEMPGLKASAPTPIQSQP